ncbi:uncharacterized protein LOC111391959 [Olea europaea var. sylvestris]|uniref:uncharacterized protein LOC111391959 n=1 Tax=Olea europaea var. sylvestris TaxID=158386 RepID=UPI000C1D4A9F|nr:uncharacterized protein LOC111391959 [Olea europaea var. sylvestris]
MDSSEVARIIQEGITTGLQRNARGLTDPINHLNIYTDVMNLQVALDRVMCKAFPQTLTHAAKDWFSTLEPNSIASFSDLADKFSAFFASSKGIRKTATSLMQLCQGQNETLRDFMKRFNKERLQIPDLHITAVVSALTHAIRCETFKMSLSKTPPKSVTELLTRGEKYINMEETLNLRRVGPTFDGAKHKRQRELYLQQDLARGKQKQGTPPTLTYLNTSRSNILMEIKDMKEFKWPPRLRSPLETRNKNKYCDYHRDHGHTTEDCITLQREIEALIKRGFLKEYIRHDKHPRNDCNNGKTTESGGGNQTIAGTINLIIEGIASGEDSNNGCKQYARRHSSIQMTAPNDMKDITFGSKDSKDISYPHDDALVISAIIANFEVRRVLVDNGSAANVSSQEAFMKMGISVNQFKTVKISLQGFGGRTIIPEGIVDLPLTLG